MNLRNARLQEQEGLWDIVFDKGVIESIAPSNETVPLQPKELDLGGGLVTRTFADVHMHLDKAFNAESAINKSGTLDEAIRIGADLKQQSNQEATYRKILRGARFAVRNGTTRIRTHIDVDPIAKLTGVEAALRAKEALAGLIDLQIVAFPQEGIVDQQGVRELLDESLKMGCDVVGGIPSRETDPKQHIKEVFELAAYNDVPVDMHVDESDDPVDLTLLDCVAATLDYRYTGRVTASHCCSLYAQEPGRRASSIEKISHAGIHVVTLPSTNLYLQGRGDKKNPRRGLTPLKELLAAGVNVAYGSDNIRDPFDPFGNANLNEIGLILAHAAHMGGMDELDSVFEMATWRGAALMDSIHSPAPPNYGITAGELGNLLVWQGEHPRDILVTQQKPTYVLLGGQVIVARSETIQEAESLTTLID